MLGEVRRTENEGETMGLSDYEVGAAVAVRDIGPARRFYEEQLGLPVSIDSGDHVQFQCGGNTKLMVFVSPYAGTAKSTQCGWEVPDLEPLVDELIARGVTFEQYD